MNAKPKRRNPHKKDQEFNEVLRRMLNTPPKPHSNNKQSKNKDQK